MSTLYPGQFQRLVEILLPSGGGIFVMFEGYFDESGDLETQPGVFCISGYFIHSEAAAAMDAEWCNVLETRGLPYFHMVDCAHGNGVFAGMSKQDRSDTVRELIALIKKYTSEGFTILANAGFYEPPDNDAPDPYSYCAEACAFALQNFLKMNRIDSNIAYIFEQGHKNRHNAYSYIARKMKKEADTLTFAAKAQVRLLQAADLLAWQCTKYAKDYLFYRIVGEEPKREPRKDFLSLMEHDHTMIYIGPSQSMAIELWPMEKRSPFSAQLDIGKDGPVPYWRDDHDKDTPIFPVEATFGWRMGGVKMAYVGFNGFEDRKFALAFDEPRLFEAVGRFLQATSLFKESNLLPLIGVESITIEEAGERKYLRVRMPEGSSIGLDLTQQTIDKIKDIAAKL